MHMIVWAMESPTHKLLGDHKAIDEVLLVPRGWMKSPAGILAMHRKLKQYRFDIAVDPQSILKSAILARLSGAKTRLGFGGDHGREMSPWLNNCHVKPTTTHLVDRSLELIQPIIADAAFRYFGLTVPEEAERFASIFQEQQLAGKPFVAINPGASWPSKRWEVDRFAELARAIASDPGITPVITWAGKEENTMAEAIVESSGGAAVMAPATSLAGTRRLVPGIGEYLSDATPDHCTSRQPLALPVSACTARPALSIRVLMVHSTLRFRSATIPAGAGSDARRPTMRCARSQRRWSLIRFAICWRLRQYRPAALRRPEHQQEFRFRSEQPHSCLFVFRESLTDAGQTTVPESPASDPNQHLGRFCGRGHEPLRKQKRDRCI